jgi:hypothetical protein
MVLRLLCEKFKRIHTASLNSLKHKIHSNYLQCQFLLLTKCTYLDGDDQPPSNIQEHKVICSENHTKYINALFEQNTPFRNIQPGGSYSYR